MSIGLKGLAITDHHCIEAYWQARQWLLSRTNPSTRPHLWVGLEVTAKLDDVEVHILGYDFITDHPALAPYLSGDRPTAAHNQAEQVIAAIHQAQGLAVLAHPSRYRKPADHLIPLAAKVGIDGIEAYYAYGKSTPWQSSIAQTQQALAWGQQLQLFCTCGTDSHGKSILTRL